MGTKKGTKKGFTLMEVMLVVIIVAILAAMALPSYARMMERARVRDARAVLNLIYQAERLYRLDQGSYTTLRDPVGLTGLVESGYLTDPDAGVNPNPPVNSGTNLNWNFDAAVNVTGTTFTATATRTGGGPAYDTTLITVDQNFTGRTEDYGPPEPDPTGLGHPMRHQ